MNCCVLGASRNSPGGSTSFKVLLQTFIKVTHSRAEGENGGGGWGRMWKMGGGHQHSAAVLAFLQGLKKNGNESSAEIILRRALGHSYKTQVIPPRKLHEYKTLGSVTFFPVSRHFVTRQVGSAANLQPAHKG